MTSAPRSAFLLAVATLLAGCGRGGEELQIPSGTPVILFSIDTLRSDRLPAYGYEGVETPALDTFAAESVLFEHAYTHAPMTLPAHASLLTGLEPNRHGVRTNVGYRLETGSHPWLPRLLADEGYRTAAAVSAMVLRAATGLSEGFELFEDGIVQRGWGQLGESQRSGHETLARIRPWLEQVGQEPFLLLFHIFEPHRPFEPPSDLRERYGATYDAEVAAADRVVAAFFDVLRELGLYDRSLIILLSDHGEGLGDHGDPEHGPLLYREVLQVPLMVRLPGARRGDTRVAEPVQLVDVFPTVVELLGLESPAELGGRSLLGRLPETRPIYAETYYPRVHFGWSELTGIIEYPYHLIRGPDPELYDLAEDPGETENILRRERRIAARLRKALESREQRFTEPGEVSRQERAQLAALGYLGSAAGAEGPRADPKAKLPVLRRLGDAYRLFRQGDHAQAVVAYRDVLENEPRLADAWEYLGHSLLQAGAAEEALAAYRRAAELTNGSPHVVLAAAGALLRLGRLQEAASHAAIAAESFPGDANNFLARIALEQGDLESAARRIEQALDTHPDHPTYLVTKARLLLERDQLPETLELADRVEGELEKGTDRNLVQGIYFVRGQAEARLGNGDAAERAFEREIDLFPHELAAYTHLSLLHALQGDAEAAGRTLQRMLEANPAPRAYAEAARTLRVLGDDAFARRLLAEGRARWPDSDEWKRGAG